MYLTQTEVEDLLGSNESADLADITDELWVQVLAGVDQVIDGYISARYAVPVTPVPAMLKEIALDLARYRLQDSNVWVAEKDAPLKARYDYALQTLADLRDGKQVLMGATASTSEAQVSVGSPQVIAATRVFSRASLEAF